MYLYQATKDPFLLEVGIDILESIEHSTKTKCGYASVSSKLHVNVNDYVDMMDTNLRVLGNEDNPVFLKFEARLHIYD